MSIAIKVENLSKKYIIGHKQQESYLTFRDMLVNKTKEVGKRLLHPFLSSSGHPISGLSNTEEFWALKDISFMVNQGDRIGIMGRNGAGKSTILKILSRITDPTTGKVSIKGRVASLLEVGTGFHPELTGRENIYLNGAILGMSKSEIKKKFDQIVAFAEIEMFLDTPVKRYSSGMYVRLAFAVAAHLEPEILIVDEVLAVGDAQFQKKCLGKMEDVGKEGRTVLFVSHNMNAIEQLCSKALLLDNGIIQSYSDDVRKVIKGYLFGQDETPSKAEWINNGKEFDNPWFKPLKFSLIDSRGNQLNLPARNDSEIWVQIEAYIKDIDPALTVGYAIYSEDGTILYWSYHTDSTEDRWPKLTQGHCKLKSNIPKRLFNEGMYKIELIGGLHFRKWLFEPGVNAPSLYLSIQGGLSESPLWIKKRPGVLAPVLNWVIQ